MPLVLTGAVVTMVEGEAPLPDGAVYVDDAGTIVAVQPADAPPPPGFEDEPRVETGGTVFPGLVELHEHLVFATVPLWTPPLASYRSRYEWPRQAGYDADIGTPAALLGLLAGADLLAYAQLKCLVGGVTTVQGSIRTTHPGRGWFLRDVEHETLGGRVSPAVSVVGAVAEADLAAVPRPGGGRLVCHLAEGVDASLRAELGVVEHAGRLGPDFVGIHANALSRDDLQRWGRHGGTLVWSPFTNLWLYGETADVRAARAAGLRLCLGSDWSPTGTKSLLGELKVAALLNATRLDGAFSAADLCAMVTRSPAEALGWDAYVGTLAAGRRADLTVVRRRTGAYEDLLTAWEDDVRLVVVDGAPLYGETALVARASGGAALERVDGDRSVVLGSRGLPSPSGVRRALESVRRDPVGARDRWASRPPHRRFSVLPAIPAAGVGEAVPPSDATLLGTRFPPLDTLTHDAAYQAKVAARMPALHEAFGKAPQAGLS